MSNESYHIFEIEIEKNKNNIVFVNEYGLLLSLIEIKQDNKYFIISDSDIVSPKV